MTINGASVTESLTMSSKREKMKRSLLSLIVVTSLTANAQTINNCGLQFGGGYK